MHRRYVNFLSNYEEGKILRLSQLVLSFLASVATSLIILAFFPAARSFGNIKMMSAV